MYLQHGNVGIGNTYLIFLAYKSISQKPKHFFHNLYKKMSYSVLDNLIIGNYDDSKYLSTFAETNISETDIIKENNN
jgi:predicted ATPase